MPKPMHSDPVEVIRLPLQKGLTKLEQQPLVMLDLIQPPLRPQLKLEFELALLEIVEILLLA